MEAASRIELAISSSLVRERAIASESSRRPRPARAAPVRPGPGLEPGLQLGGDGFQAGDLALSAHEAGRRPGGGAPAHGAGAVDGLAEKRDRLHGAEAVGAGRARRREVARYEHSPQQGVDGRAYPLVAADEGACRSDHAAGIRSAWRGGRLGHAHGVEWEEGRLAKAAGPQELHGRGGLLAGLDHEGLRRGAKGGLDGALVLGMHVDEVGQHADDALGRGGRGGARPNGLENAPHAGRHALQPVLQILQEGQAAAGGLDTGAGPGDLAVEAHDAGLGFVAAGALALEFGGKRSLELLRPGELGRDGRAPGAQLLDASGELGPAPVDAGQARLEAAQLALGGGYLVLDGTALAEEVHGAGLEMLEELLDGAQLRELLRAPGSRGVELPRAVAGLALEPLELGAHALELGLKLGPAGPLPVGLGREGLRLGAELLGALPGVGALGLEALDAARRLDAAPFGRLDLRGDLVVRVLGAGEIGLELGRIGGERPLPVAHGGQLGLHDAQALDLAGVVGHGEDYALALELVRYLLVAPRLRGLAADRAQALVDLLDDPAQDVQVLLDALELPDSGELARLVLGYPRRLLEDHAPLGGVGLEEGVDLALLDDRVGPGAQPRVHQEVLDVTEPAELLVDEVLAVARAVQAPGDGHLLVIHGQRAVRVVESEPHLGVAEGPAGARPVEDDVEHRVAAQRLGRLLAEDPLHGVDDVRLPAAVGPHKARDARLEVEGSPVGEGLESVELESLDAHVLGVSPASVPPGTG